MKKILIILIFMPTIIYSQKARIENINLDVENSNVFISYDLFNSIDSTENIELVLIDKSKNVYIPKNIQGNIGTNSKLGKNNLKFTLITQEFPLDRGLSPYVFLSNNIKNGPNAALISLIIPGLGDYFVESPKNIKVKPYIRTAAVGGFLALAIIANQNIEEPVSYEKEVWIPQHTNVWGREIPGYYETQTFKTNPKEYWLFKNDKAIFIGAAASIWIFDIFWVLTKGQRNQKIKNAIKNNKYNFAATSSGISFRLSLN